jgi:hypothetical protein
VALEICSHSMPNGQRFKWKKAPWKCKTYAPYFMGWSLVSEVLSLFLQGV